jgi:2-amino-4-hydroxy-6-hydroxymethyldihydropteridine diphosphokinase
MLLSYTLDGGSSGDLRGGDQVILVGLGGNLVSPRFGPPRETLTAALNAMEAEGIGTVALSGWYTSEPVPRSSQPWFVNAVASVCTAVGAAELLLLMQAIEGRFGRIRGQLNEARILDLDLLDFHGEVRQTPSLVLPHPRLHQRRFVLAPLAEIAPEWRHPLLGLTAEQLLALLGDEQRLERQPC